jgi:hypothetical protein
MRDGYEVFVVVDAIGGVSRVRPRGRDPAHDPGRRPADLGSRLACELQRDWGRPMRTDCARSCASTSAKLKAAKIRRLARDAAPLDPVDPLHGTETPPGSDERSRPSNSTTSTTSSFARLVPRAVPRVLPGQGSVRQRPLLLCTTAARWSFFKAAYCSMSDAPNDGSRSDARDGLS